MSHCEVDRVNRFPTLQVILAFNSYALQLVGTDVATSAIYVGTFQVSLYYSSAVQDFQVLPKDKC